MRGRAAQKQSSKSKKMRSTHKQKIGTRQFFSSQQKSTEDQQPLDELDQEFEVEAEFGYNIERLSGDHSVNTGKTQSGDEREESVKQSKKRNINNGILDDMEEAEYIDIDGCRNKMMEMKKEEERLLHRDMVVGERTAEKKMKTLSQHSRERPSSLQDAFVNE
eukprot:CAMPEP_0168608772 /NCGR_PEP_ID=MMETSP0449_2-20121227/825_1 /TAXON_ID=1082188 /ORGANISM="Strombidium rassoulzadegani, Strain ras09" /LENGTH=162 /DNA_ID=CAMNT_0008648819 /DNA_START=386 /DNA_END=874 /DNA_ORIENTATION=+